MLRFMSEPQATVTQLETIFPARFVDDRHTESTLCDSEADALSARLKKIPRAVLSPDDVHAYFSRLVTISSDARGAI